MCMRTLPTSAGFSEQIKCRPISEELRDWRWKTKTELAKEGKAYNAPVPHWLFPETQSETLGDLTAARATKHASELANNMRSAGFEFGQQLEDDLNNTMDNLENLGTIEDLIAADQQSED